MSIMGVFFRPRIGEGGTENNRFASKASNALTFFLSDGFIGKVRVLVRPPFHRSHLVKVIALRQCAAGADAPTDALQEPRRAARVGGGSGTPFNSRPKHLNSAARGHEHERRMNGVARCRCDYSAMHTKRRQRC
jgi:hypothetical protein